MDCSKAEELIADRALGFIQSDEEMKLEKHLAECPDCRREADEYSLAVSALKEEESVQHIAGLSDTVLAEVGSPKQNKFRIIKLSLPALAAAAVLLAVIISPVFFSNNGNDMTKLEVLEAYAQDMEILGLGEDITVANAEFDYESYGVSDKVSEYLVQ